MPKSVLKSEINFPNGGAPDENYKNLSSSALFPQRKMLRELENISNFDFRISTSNEKRPRTSFLRIECLQIFENLFLRKLFPQYNRCLLEVMEDKLESYRLRKRRSEKIQSLKERFLRMLSINTSQSDANRDETTVNVEVSWARKESNQNYNSNFPIRKRNLMTKIMHRYPPTRISSRRRHRIRGWLIVPGWFIFLYGRRCSLSRLSWSSVRCSSCCRCSLEFASIPEWNRRGRKRSALTASSTTTARQSTGLLRLRCLRNS